MALAVGWNGPLGLFARQLVWADSDLDHASVTTFLKSDSSALEILSRLKHVLKDSAKSGQTGSPGQRAWLKRDKCVEMVLDPVLEDVLVSLVSPVVAGIQSNKELVLSAPALGVNGLMGAGGGHNPGGLLSCLQSAQSVVVSNVSTNIVRLVYKEREGECSGANKVYHDCLSMYS